MYEITSPIKMDKILASDNVAELLSDSDLDHVGVMCSEEFDIDCKSREGWEDNIKEWVNLAMQVKETKTSPWPGAANVKYPLLTTAALQFSARAYPSLLPGVNPVRGRVIGFDDDGTKTERAIRVGKHMSWQILVDMDDWEEEMDRLLFALPIVGCMFKKTYYCPIKGKNKSEVVYPLELVVNYWAKNLEEADRISHVLASISNNDIHERVVSGLWLDRDYTKDQSDHMDNPTDEATGIMRPGNEDSSMPYIFVEQCRYLDLDGDGYEEPYNVTFDRNSGKVARITKRFQEENIETDVKGEILKIHADKYYTKFSFIPSPDGSFYDIGFGILLGPINETINTLINQLLDAGTLSNLQAGFIAKGIRIKGGDRPFLPGEWKFANTVGDDLRKGIVPLPVRDPSNVLFSLLGMMIESGEKLSSVTEIMTGDIPGQNTKATVAMAAIEQGMKVFSSIYKRTHRSLSKEYKLLFLLNNKYLPNNTTFTILDVGVEKASTIGGDDYDLDDMDVVPASDPNVATEQQRIAKIEALGQLLSLGTINPMEYTKRYLEATEQPDIESLMKMPPPQPNPEVEMEKQKLEQEYELQKEENEIKRLTAMANAIKAMADAEGVEQGNQMEQYKKQVEMLMKGQESREKLRQNEEAHQQKMSHQAQAEAQKQALKEESERQKIELQRRKMNEQQPSGNGE